MRDLADRELLRLYTGRNSEEAFAALVARHVNLVYSAALRKTGNPHAAEEVTQAVFVILARKSRTLPEQTVLSGWLYQTARLTAANFLRGSIRRVQREQEAYMQSLLNEPQSEAWSQITPLLEDAIGQLGEKDRNAIVLRFFEGKSFQEIGFAFGASENAAKKRVGRGLEKLRGYFSKRGVVVPAAVLIAAISANSVHAAPAALAKTAADAALAGGSAASASTATLIKSTLKLMAWTKAKIAIGIGVGVLLTAGTTTVVVAKVEAHREYYDSWRSTNLNSDVVAQTAPQVKILPTRFDNSVSGLSSTVDSKKWGGIGVRAREIVWAAYGCRPGRILFSDGEPRERYDFISTLSQGTEEALQREMKDKLGLVGRRETRDMDVLVVRVRTPGAPGLKPPISGDGDDWNGNGRYICGDRPISTEVPAQGLTKFLESYFEMPVIDETGLTQHFHIDLRWHERGGGDPNHDALKQALLDQLGLELVPDHRPVEMLIMEKAVN
jgi:uncharacterized protein (TIGR03435 family)